MEQAAPSTSYMAAQDSVCKSPTSQSRDRRARLLTVVHEAKNQAQQLAASGTGGKSAGSGRRSNMILSPSKRPRPDTTTPGRFGVSNDSLKARHNGVDEADDSPCRSKSAPPRHIVGHGPAPAVPALSACKKSRQELDDDISTRIISLPHIVCKAANGELFLVDPGHVRGMLVHKRLADLGLVMDVEAIEAAMTSHSRRSPSPVLHDTLASSAGTAKRIMQSSRPPGSPVRRSNIGQALDAEAAKTRAMQAMPVMDGEVRWRVQRMDEKIAEWRVAFERKAAAAKRRSVPGAVGDASAACGLSEGEESDDAGGGSVKRRSECLTGPSQRNQHAARKSAGGMSRAQARAAERAAAAGRRSPSPGRAGGDVNDCALAALGEPSPGWQSVQHVVQRNTSHWHQHNKLYAHWKSGHKPPEWGDVIVMNDIYMKRRQGAQGTVTYETTCQELGVAASSRVLTQLTQPTANLAHCKLGRHGATALAHALGANTVVTELDLTDNNLDAKAIAEIVHGLVAATAAGLTAKQRAHTVAFAKEGMAAIISQRAHAAKYSNSAASQHRIPPAGPADPASSGDAEELAQDSSLGGRKGAKMMKNSISVRVGFGDGDDLASDSAPPSPMERQSPPAAAGSSSSGSSGMPGAQRSPSQRAKSGAGAAAAALSRSNSAAAVRPALQRSVSELAEHLYSKLHTLDLSENPLGAQGARVVANLIDPEKNPGQFLVHLTLNKCSIPEAGGMQIARALTNGNKNLVKLFLSNNHLGNKTADAFGELLEANHTLRELDLSWNQIKADGAKALARGLATNASLRVLVMAWNGLENEGCGAMGEMLMANCGLKLLDLGHTRMGGEACLLLAEGLKSNVVLEVLLLNGNAVGENGSRHLMSGLNHNKSLQFLGLQGSNMTAAARDADGGAAEFNPASPDGSYTLHLSVAVERAVAVQLASIDRASGSDLMKNIRLDGKTIGSCTKADWPANMPARGTLMCDFQSKKARRGVQILEQRKFASLERQFHLPSVSDKERCSLVEMFAPFTYLSCQQISTALSTFGVGPDRVTAAVMMILRCADSDQDLSAMLHGLVERDAHGIRAALGGYADYRFTNAMGHYELNLSNIIHHHIANRLKDVAFTEPDGSNWINIVYETYTETVKTPSSYGPPQDWKGLVPHEGTLSVDFVSTLPLPEGATAMSDEELKALLTHEVHIQFAQGCPVPERDFVVAEQQLAALRLASAHMLVTCAQVKMIVECFVASPHRVEVAVLLYAFVTDCTENFWTVLYCLTGIEQANVAHRLGPANIFNAKHCSIHWVLDLVNPHHEEVAKKLVAMAIASGELPNLWNIRMRGFRKYVTENANMWGMLTAESFTPFLEFDFIGADGWEALGRTAADVASLTPGDKLDMRTRQAARLEVVRMRQLYHYYDDGSGVEHPCWASWNSLMQPLVDKSPWLASWDRMCRILVRYEQRNGGISGDSPLEDLYDAHASEENEMTATELETLLKSQGCNKNEIAHYLHLMEAAVKPQPQPQLEPAPGDAATASAASPAPDSSAKAAVAAAFGRPGSSGQTPARGSTPPTTSPSPLPRAGVEFASTSADSAAAAAAAAAARRRSSTPTNRRTPTKDNKGHPLSAGSTGTAGSTAETLEAMYRGITFSEFVRIFLTEPPKAPRFKELVGSMAALLGGGLGGLLGKGKQKGGFGSMLLAAAAPPATAAPAATATEAAAAEARRSSSSDGVASARAAGSESGVVILQRRTRTASADSEADTTST